MASMAELYQQLSSSPAFARLMMQRDQEGGGLNDPQSWGNARLRTQGLNIPPMPQQQAMAPPQMPPQAFSALGAPQGAPPHAPMPPVPPPMPPQAPNRGGGGGFLSGLLPEGPELRERLGDMLLGMTGGATMNDSLAGAGRSMMAGRMARRGDKQAAAQENRTRQYAIQLGIPQDVAMGLDATNLMALIKEKYEAQNTPEKPIVVNGRLVMPSTGKVTYESPPDPMSPADEARIGLDRDRFEFEQSKTDPEWEKLSDGSLFNKRTGETKAVPRGQGGGVDFKDIHTLRGQIQDTPQIKNYMQAAPIYRSMVETAPRNSKASDLNLVYGLGKIMDPTSVVRDGERVAVANTASLPDWLQGAIASLNGGSALTPETRQRILEEARSRMDAYRAETDALKSQYEGIASRYGIPMDDIWQPLEKLPDYTAALPGGGSGTAPVVDADGWTVLPNGVRIREKAP